jgi:hypothetical protein
MWSTACSAMVALSATTTMPRERSEGGRLKTATGTSLSWASRTMVVALSPSCGIRMMPSTPCAMQSRTCSNWRFASSCALRSITVWPASVRVSVIAWWPATQNSVSRSWKAKQIVACAEAPVANTAPAPARIVPAASFCSLVMRSLPVNARRLRRRRDGRCP